MYEDILYECGLTQNETAVYLALLKLGKAKSGEIVREAKISGGKIYETLYKLIEKGLVKEVIENGIKRFISNDPKTLLTYLEEKTLKIKEKKEQLEKIIPGFYKLSKNESEIESVSIIKNLRGISTIVYGCLEKAKQIKAMGLNSSKDERYNNFWRGWHRKRVSLKKEAQIIFSDKNTEYLDFFKSLSHTKIKYILHFSPSAIMIVDNNILIFSYGEEITCIHIISEPIKKSFLNFFDDLWKIAES